MKGEKMTRKSEWVGFRADAKTLAQLHYIARMMRRTPSDAMREAIRLAFEAEKAKREGQTARSAGQGE
jgi:hypothetical protein